MEIEIRSDSVHITGYVNAVGRDSRPLIAECGKCVEQIAPGTFSRALRAAENVALKLDHGRVIGGTKDGTLKLTIRQSSKAQGGKSFVVGRSGSPSRSTP